MEKLKKLDAICHGNSADIRSALQQIVPAYHPSSEEQPQEQPDDVAHTAKNGVLAAGTT